MSRSTLEKPDAQFLAQANTIYLQCSDHTLDWKLDAKQLDTFSTLLANAVSAYEDNLNKATKNAITAATKKAAFGELKHFLGMYINILEVNLNVPDEALQYMGLRPRQHQAHQPLPPPKDLLVLSVRKQNDEMTLYASRPEQDHPTASVGPTHYHGFMIRYRIEDDAKYQTVVSTRLHHTLFFEREDAGKRIYLSGAWVNPRLEHGPWSDEIIEIIG